METNTIKDLENFMYRKDMTQEQLALRLHVSFQTVNRWFNGHTEPSRRNWFKIKKFLEPVMPKDMYSKPLGDSS